MKIAEGLRLQVRVLHHPDAARRTIAAGRPTRSSARRARWPRAASRNCCSSRRTRPSTASTAHERGALARLLRELNAIDGLEWIRLLYLYPTTIDDDTLAAMAECDKVCKYIDLPLQHASNPVLQAHEAARARGRTTTGCSRASASACPASRSAPRSSSGSRARPTADVDELCAFVDDHAFDHVGVFTYSHEEGTSAYALDDDVPARVEDGAAQPGDGPAEAARRQAAARAGSASGSGSSSTARRRTTSWSCKARLADPGARHRRRRST